MTQTEADAQEAADRAVDPTGLLDGEDPRSAHPDDIDHWIHAYSELIDFKKGVLAASQGEISEMRNPDSRKEADQVDLTILEAEMHRYQQRLDFWKRRQSELSS